MASNRNLLVHWKHCFSALSLRSYLAEFIPTFLLVFIVVGSARMLTTTPDVTSSGSASPLVATAIAQTSPPTSPVVTSTLLSRCLRHRRPHRVPSAIFYWASQLLGATLACLSLNLFSADERIAVAMTGFGGAVLEGVLTFLLVYTAHVVGVSNGGKRGFAATALGALAVGLTAGALTDASMNPAGSFGAAVASGHFKNQAVYWAGPMVGAAVAALVYQILACPDVAESSSPHGNVEAVVV